MDRKQKQEQSVIITDIVTITIGGNSNTIGNSKNNKNFLEQNSPLIISTYSIKQ